MAIQILQDLADRLDATPLAQLMRDTPWAVPLVQTLHILAIAAVFSASLLLMLRTFALLDADWSWAGLGRKLVRWSTGGLVVLLLSGTLMVAGEPARSLLNTLFQIKMLLVIVATFASWRLARGLQAAGSVEDAGYAQPTAKLKLLALSTLALWMLIVSAGRWIAYYEN